MKRFTAAHARKAILTGVVIGAALVALAACAPGNPTQNAQNNGDVFNRAKADLITANSQKVVTADEWQHLYPDQYNSMQKNAEDDEIVSYLEEKPYLADIYAGTPFSKHYDKARGHAFAIHDVQNTERISDKTKASCYACKGSYYPSHEWEDEALFKRPFAEVTDAPDLNNIACYDCHLNNPPAVLASRDFFNKAFPTAAKDWGDSAAACGQCHNEYYFDAQTGAVSLPPNMTDPEDILNYYNGIEFVDYTNPNNGVKQLKAQHPEVYMFADSKHQKVGLSCSDCHMEKLVDENGQPYTSHEIVNPLESENIQQNVCARCHADPEIRVNRVKDIQAKTEAREDELGEKLKSANDKLTEIVKAGSMSEDDLNAIRSDIRNAMWYWDFEFVENSTGFHNQAKTQKCFINCEKYLDSALEKMNG